MKKKGFTLTEILVVITVLSILFVIAVPVTSGIKNTLEKKVAAENIKALNEAAKLLAIDLSDPTSDVYNCKDETWFNCSKENGKWKTIIVSVSSLKEKGYFEDKSNNCSGKIEITNDETGKYSVNLENSTCINEESKDETIVMNNITSEKAEELGIKFNKETGTIEECKTEKGCKLVDENKVLNIPKSIGGVAITSIKDNAFRYDKEIKKVILPEGIKTIGNSVFSECYNLEEVNIPESVESIGSSIFTNCFKLKELYIPKNVSNIGTSSFCTACSNLEKLEVDPNNNYYSSENNVLYNKNKTELIKFISKNNMESFALPGSVSKIRMYAFYSCPNLKEIILPKNLSSINYSLCIECNNLVKISLDTINQYYVLENNTLFNKNKTELIAYASSENINNYDVPNTVTKIWTDAFQYAHISNITIPSSVKVVEFGALNGYINNIYLYTNENITLGPSAFSVKQSGSIIHVKSQAVYDLLMKNNYINKTNSTISIDIE